MGGVKRAPWEETLNLPAGKGSLLVKGDGYHLEPGGLCSFKILVILNITSYAVEYPFKCPFLGGQFYLSACLLFLVIILIIV